MHHLSKKIKKEILPFVIKPGRYLGNELNIIRKQPEDKLKFALVYPDKYLTHPVHSESLARRESKAMRALGTRNKG